jgi:hypothetical protein
MLNRAGKARIILSSDLMGESPGSAKKYIYRISLHPTGLASPEDIKATHVASLALAASAKKEVRCRRGFFGHVDSGDAAVLWRCSAESRIK